MAQTWPAVLANMCWSCRDFVAGFGAMCQPMPTVADGLTKSLMGAEFTQLIQLIGLLTSDYHLLSELVVAYGLTSLSLCITQ